MKKLNKKEQKAIIGGNDYLNCMRECRYFLQFCTGPLKSDCPDYLACIEGC